MVFKPINLARQSFIKTFTHGYAQSLVAASQTSSASQNTSFHTLTSGLAGGLFSKTTTTQSSQYATASSANAAAGTGPGVNAKAVPIDAPGHDGGLAAYYAAWQKHQRPEEKEWHEFQFAKRIGWKAPTTIPESQPQTQSSRAAAPRELSAPTERAQIQRSRSTTAVDEYLKKERQEHVQNTEDNVLRSQQEEPSAQAQENTTQVQEVSLEVVSAASESLVDSPTSGSPFTSRSSVTEISYIEGTDSFTQHLTHLAEAQRHAEIPPVFESMLLAGKQPTSSAYNALLLAAINLTKGKHQVVPRALDVYADMLRRRVEPDTSTYAILIELLSARALDVTLMKRELLEKKSRYGNLNGSGTFLLRSDEVEMDILSQDDSLTLAIRLFDTSAALSTSHLFPAETYRLLISSCAEQGCIGDMVRVYANMESQKINPPTSIFAPMILSFARAGDLRSAVECYDEYKALAVAHDHGNNNIVRKDEEVYAAVVQAYCFCGQSEGGLKFLGKVQDAQDQAPLLCARDIVYRALLPVWLKEGHFAEAIEYAQTESNLSSEAPMQILSAVCIDAADKDLAEPAMQAFSLLNSLNANRDNSKAIVAMLAMHSRKQDLSAASALWRQLKTTKSSASLIEPATVYGLCAIASNDFSIGLGEVRKTFARMRSLAATNSGVEAQIEEAIEVLCHSALASNTIMRAGMGTSLLHMMLDNETIITSAAERLVAGLGPNEISQLNADEFDMLLQVQSKLIMSQAQLDLGHAARLAHMMEIVMSTNPALSQTAANSAQHALQKIGRTDLLSRWQAYQHPVMTLPSPHLSLPSPTMSMRSGPVYDDAFDPYASSTDFKGSAVIADELEKPYGSHAMHLNEALVRFKNMRRIGRHPRYLTYAKLITAAAKENRLNLATEVLEMAKQDIPFIPESRVVRHGWVAILDSMVGASLSVGERDVAAKYHQQLHDMGAAPSANTFGLYITTLKESTKTFDEATEAVKIFQRAMAEGVEPSSFLYNALIGKLGKARRIDDCLYYFAEMRTTGIRPTSVTYGTIVNALCRVSDDKFAEELFEEMESMPNYKPRPAPYNSLMQYFLTTKRDRTKVLAYYERMKNKRIEPTMHTYKLLIDTYATLEPVNLEAAQGVLDAIRASGHRPEAAHYAALIHARGCVLHDLHGARGIFDSVLAEGQVAPQASLYQALFESMVANHDVSTTDEVLQHMTAHRVSMTPYIANTLIHGWATAKNITKAEVVFESLGRDHREPSTYEAMTRAYLAADQHGNAMKVVGEALRRGYPSAVAGKICDLVRGGAKALSHEGR